MTRALANPDLISLAAGFVDQDTLPVESTQEAILAVFTDASTARQALQYGNNQGNPALRQALVDRLRSADQALGADLPISTDHVIITTGSNQLLHLINQTLFDPGDIVLVTAPTYLVLLGMLAAQSVQTLGITMDQLGIVPEALEDTLSRLNDVGELPRVKAIYLASYFDNPSSVNLTLSRRAKLVEVAQRWSRHGRIHLIEDTAYRELRYLGNDLPSLRSYDETGETVIVTGTFSKSFSPGLRIGWGILPKDLVEPIAQQKSNLDFGSPHLAQHVLHQVLRQGLWDQHVQILCENYSRKMEAMLEAMDEHFRPLQDVTWFRPQGGLYLWVTLPQHVKTGPDGPLLQQALDCGVLYVPGEYCFPTESNQHSNTIRLSFGAQTTEKLRHGVQALAEAVRPLV